MRLRFNNLSIGGKLLTALILSSGIGFLVLIVLLPALQMMREHSERLSEMRSVARVIALNSRAAVAFDEHRAGREVLGAALSLQLVMGGRIYTDYGVFVETAGLNRALPPALSAAELPVIAADEPRPPRLLGIIRIVQPIVLDGENVGWVELVADSREIWLEVAEDFSSVIAVGLLSALLSVAFALYFRRLLATPIEKLAAAANRIAIEEDYSLEVDYSGRDEIGTLVRGFSQMLRKIDERTHQLREAKELALTASHAKSEFLAAMSHEIRTPIYGMIGAVEVMKEEPLTPQARRMAEIAEASGRALLATVDDVLDFSRIEAGKIELVPVAFDLQTLARESCEMLQNQALTKGLDLRWTISPQARGRYRGDYARLRQVLTNLLSNAVKFTRRGGVELAVSIVDSADDTQPIHFEVKDTGIGIPGERIGQLFEPFVQLGGGEGPLRGTGLGLAVCRRLSTFMGGRIGVESEPGVGSVFWLTIPLQRIDDDVPAPAPDERLAELRARVRERQLSVLLVDDHPANVAITSAMLGLAGVGVRSARDGNEALEALRGGAYDAVLLDLRMPDPDGYAVLKTIRDEERSGAPGRHQFVAALTAYATRAERDRCIEVGFDECLVKPVTQAQLLTLLAGIAEDGTRSQ